MLMLLMATHPVLGGKARFLDPSSAVKASDADSILAEDIALAAGTPGSRVLELEESLRETYGALPKNSNSRLGHQAVLYALHRFFVQRHGWHISGLAPGGDVWRQMVPSGKDVSLDEWVPSYLLNRVEERLGNHGITLRELAALAAMLEDLVRKDADTQMKLVYELYDFPTSGTIDRKQAELVLDTYFMVYLLARKFTSNSTKEALVKRRRFTQTYHNLTEAEVWFHSLELRHLGADAEEIDFAATSGIAKDVGEEFSKFNDQECMDLKKSLRALQGRTVKGGRVRLPDFYNASRYSHWKFTERPEYLRAIGAFDDSDPKQQYVVVPNYIQSRSNCLQASPLYAVCCRNECEDLMQHLEAKIAAPTATADRIAALVAALPSDTVAAPRRLPETLIHRLNQIAATAKGNVVNLHGRLFAQWMHHAYPAECPYPHEAGTTSEQTPSQWKEATGEVTHTASELPSLPRERAMAKMSEQGLVAADAHGASEEEETTMPFASSAAREFEQRRLTPRIWAVVVGLTVFAALVLVGFAALTEGAVSVGSSQVGHEIGAFAKFKHGKKGDKKEGNGEDESDEDGGERADAFAECLGEGEKNLKCKMGCQCVRKNDYYHQCKPPEGSQGCDIEAAKELVKAAKKRAQPFIKAEHETRTRRNRTFQVAEMAAAKAAKAKKLAFHWEDAWKKTSKLEDEKRAKPVNAAKKTVADAKAAVAKVLAELKKTKEEQHAKVVRTVAPEKKDRDATAAEEDRTAKEKVVKQAAFDKAAKDEGAAAWKASDVLKGVQVWVDSLKVTWKAADQYVKCGGTGVPKQTCSAGCICIKKNEYYHACQPPPGMDGCKPENAQTMVDKVKNDNSAVFAAADQTKAAKKAASEALLGANVNAKKARKTAAKALATYESKLKNAEADAARVVGAVQKRVNEAQAALKKAETQEAHVIKTRDAAVEKKLAPLIKKKALTSKISKRLTAKAEDAESVRIKADQDWKAAATKLKDFYVEVKKWEETLV